MRIQTWSFRTVLLPLLGVVLIAGSFLAVWLVGRSQARRVPVVVAATTLAPLTVITPAQVRLEQLPTAAVPAGAFRSLADVVGHFTGFGVVPGDIVRPAMLLAGANGSNLDVQLQAASQTAGTTLEAVPLPLDASTGYTLPRAGDHVSFLGVLGQTGATPQATTILSHVLVLQAAGATSAAPAAAGTGILGAPSQPTATTRPTSGVLILALSPTDAERLLLAEASGKITLVLDPAGEDACPAPSPAGSGAPAPKPETSSTAAAASTAPPCIAPAGEVSVGDILPVQTPAAAPSLPHVGGAMY